MVFAGVCFLACAPAKNYLGPQGPKFTGRYATNQPVFKDTLKVVSFNIAFAREIDRAINELSTVADLKDADILLLQEMDETGTDAIAKALACNYVYYPATLHPMSHRNFGNAILSKWPIRNERKILLPYEVPGRRTRRIAVDATINVNTHEILTFSLHTATILQGEEKRLAQADSVLKSIPKNQGQVIVGGDFNTMTKASSQAHIFLFMKNHFVWASRGVGSTGTFGPFGLTLDHVFVRGLRVVGAGKVKASQASDHLPVWVKLVVE